MCWCIEAGRLTDQRSLWQWYRMSELHFACPRSRKMITEGRFVLGIWGTAKENTFKTIHSVTASTVDQSHLDLHTQIWGYIRSKQHARK